jgi:peptidoglycan/xylan/chitin deacetylase (PgdA/CDA1 family)
MHDLSSARRDGARRTSLSTRIPGVAWIARALRAWTQSRIGPISHVSTEEPVVALTFDDGPQPDFTSRLLQVLAKHGAHATFFMLGTMARRHRDIVRMVAEQGHAIGNHTADHPSLPLVSRYERWRQIRSCSRALAPYEHKLFRPPYGQRDFGSCVDAALLGYSIIAWNAHAFDWLDHDAEWMVKHMISQIRPGSIITLHDALHNVIETRYADRSPTVRAVDLLLEQMGGKYQFVTVPELLRYGRAERQTCFGTVNRDFLEGLKPNDGPLYNYGAEMAGR